MYVKRTDEELKQLAVDTAEGKVFFDMQVKDPRDLYAVFLPLAFAGEKYLESLIAQKVCYMYEYLSEAGPMAVNGMPTFMTVRFLDGEDYEKFREHLIKYVEMRKSFMGESGEKVCQTR